MEVANSCPLWPQPEESLGRPPPPWVSKEGPVYIFGSARGPGPSATCRDAAAHAAPGPPGGRGRGDGAPFCPAVLTLAPPPFSTAPHAPSIQPAAADARGLRPPPPPAVWRAPPCGTGCKPSWRALWTRRRRALPRASRCTAACPPPCPPRRCLLAGPPHGALSGICRKELR